MRKYVFSDEAGDFNFRPQKASRYFILCTICLEDCAIGHHLMDLKRDMIWRGLQIRNYFHAVDDLPHIRDEVYDLISQYDFTIQATIMEKSKAMPKVRVTNAMFFQYGWLYHFKHRVVPGLKSEDELQITAASIGTKRGQKAYSSAVNDVIQQHLPRSQRKTFFPAAQQIPACKSQITVLGRYKENGNWEELRNTSLSKTKSLTSTISGRTVTGIIIREIGNPQARLSRGSAH